MGRKTWAALGTARLGMNSAWLPLMVPPERLMDAEACGGFDHRLVFKQQPQTNSVDSDQRWHGKRVIRGAGELGRAFAQEQMLTSWDFRIQCFVHSLDNDTPTTMTPLETTTQAAMERGWRWQPVVDDDGRETVMSTARLTMTRAVMMTIA